MKKDLRSRKEPITFRIDPNLKENLNELAKKLRKKPSKLINLSIEQFLENKMITEISLLLEIQHLNTIGFENYVNMLRKLAKKQNISDEDMCKFLKTIIERMWQSTKPENQ